MVPTMGQEISSSGNFLKEVDQAPVAVEPERILFEKEYCGKHREEHRKEREERGKGRDLLREERKERDALELETSRMIMDMVNNDF